MMTKRLPPPATKDCYSCGSGAPATCLGGDRTFRPCALHWPLFTYCSQRCAGPHRKELNAILFRKLTKA